MEPEPGASEQGLEVRFPPPPLHYAAAYSAERLRDGTAPPPPPPIQGVYRSFGVAQNSEESILPPLSELGIRALYNPAADPKAELKQLNRSIVAAFLDLVEILVRCPESAERVRKIEDLRLLFINLHHLVNEYRPRQARETLTLMLELQGRERTATAQSFQAHFSAVRERLAEALTLLPSQPALPPHLLNRIKAVTEPSSAHSLAAARRAADQAHQKDLFMAQVLDMS